MCSSPPAAHLVQVTGLVPGGAAERSEAVKPGDLFNAVDGKDVTTLTDAQVAALCRGAPNTPLTLTLFGKAPPSQEKLYQAARNGNIMEAKALLAAGAEADALFRGITISRAK
ncbi:MAG: PDZ domain-containing protein [Promethearchaeia archaeon]